MRDRNEAERHSFVASLGDLMQFDECVEWPYYRDRDGYAVLGRRRVAQAAAEISDGPRPAGMQVRHLCNNPPCVNPLHVRWGTPTEQHEDQRRAGTLLLGSDTRHSRLTAGKVQEIRAAVAEGESDRSIARRFGVTHRSIRLIRTGETWGWLE